MAGFKYHLYADNFKFYIKTQSEPLSSEPIHPCADIPWTSWLTSDKRPPDSAPALGLSGLLMAEVPPWISSQLSLLQAAFLPAAFGCGLHHHLWMVTLCSSAEVSALQSHTAAAKESDELGMTFAFPSSLPGLPRQQERSQASCHGWPGSCLSCLFSTLYPGAPALNTLLPQGLCTCGSLGLGCFSPKALASQEC